MEILHNVDLSRYSTMRIGDKAKNLVTVKTKDELIDAVEWAKQRNLPVLVIGGGSNIIFKDGFDGLIIVNRILGFDIISKDNNKTVVKVGAGEDWDQVVAKTVDMNLSGIEMLSYIPGTTGATPVQNVGAYGTEIANVLTELEAFDTDSKQFITLTNADCNFSYRNSIFKSPKNRHYIIVSLTMQLSSESPKPPFYEALQRHLDDNNITEYTPKNIRQAVIAIRTSKLPNPAKIANTGSFFKNPIISVDEFTKISREFPDMPNWPTQDGKIKIPAGWLMDKAGLKGYSSHGMKIYNNNALVFVNESAKSYQDLAAFKQEIVNKVQAKFGITLEQEPELI